MSVLGILFVALLAEGKIITSMAVVPVHSVRNRFEAAITRKPGLVASILLVIVNLFFDSLRQILFKLLGFDRFLFVVSADLGKLCPIIEQLVVDVVLLLQVTGLIVHIFIVLVVEHLFHRLVIDIWDEVCLELFLSLVEQLVVLQDVVASHELSLF